MPFIYKEKDLNLVDQALTRGMFTNVVETNNVDWTGARDFRVKDITTSGYQYHTRNKGWNPGTVTQTRDTYTLQFDRDIEFFVDVMDVDETDQELAASAITGKFIEKQARPEIDAFRFMKMAEAAKEDNTITSETLSAATIFDRLKTMIAPIRKYGTQNITAWLSSEAMGLLERSPEWTRNFDVLNSGTAIETRVTSIDGVQLMEVWDDDRMFTEFDFTDGFVPTSTAGKIQIMMVARPGIVAKIKHSAIMLFGVGEHSQGDGWLYQNRMYHDLWRLHQHKGVVVASVKE